MNKQQMQMLQGKIFPLGIITLGSRFASVATGQYNLGKSLL